MAIKSKEEILNSVKTLLGENQTDEALNFLEDIEDTFNDLSSKISNPDKEDWKAKYEENDRTWRQRYRDRFFGGTSDKPDHELEAPQPEVKEIPHNPETYDELFTVKEK